MHAMKYLLPFVLITLSALISPAPAADSSTCGINWKRANPLPNDYFGFPRDVVWSGSQFVAAGYGGIITSTDGVTWSVPSSGAGDLHGVAWSGTQFVAVGLWGTILTSTDGMTWTQRSSGTGVTLNDVTWSGSQFVAVGAWFGTILTSSDGVNWTTRR